MLKTATIAVALAAATLVLPAAAGSWPPTPPRKSTEARKATEKSPPAVRVVKAQQPKSIGGFEYVGGDAGWQLAQHKYEFTNGKLVMSDECDHAIRSAQAPTPSDVESARRLSPGV